MVKARNARKFLEDGHRVKVSLRFKGREVVHRELGKKVLERLVKETEDIGKAEFPSSRSSRFIELYLTPKKGKGEREKNA